MPRKEISDVYSLTPKDLPLLDHLQTVSEVIKSKHPQVSFQIGFHALPSMTQLHLHLISTDFDSPLLKHKKHWNSFTTDFFLSFHDVRAELQDQGRIDLDKKHYEQLLRKPLECHKCHESFDTMPSLKHHIRECK